jgi:hypothetical protein
VNLDVSVAPEIAQVISPLPGGPGAATTAAGAGAATHPGGGHDGAASLPATVGRLAQELRAVTAAPERWWSLVRFDPERPVQVSIPAGPSCEAWLMIIPPSQPGGWTGEGGGIGHGDCGCEVVTVIAGELTEQAIGTSGLATTPLLPGKIRVHGRGRLHRVLNRSNGYAVSVHARAKAPGPAR